MNEVFEIISLDNNRQVYRIEEAIYYTGPQEAEKPVSFKLWLPS